MGKRKLVALLCLPSWYRVRDCYVALPRGAIGLSAICDCGISWSFLLTIDSNTRRTISGSSTAINFGVTFEML